MALTDLILAHGIRCTLKHLSLLTGPGIHGTSSRCVPIITCSILTVSLSVPMDTGISQSSVAHQSSSSTQNKHRYQARLFRQTSKIHPAPISRLSLGLPNSHSFLASLLAPRSLVRSFVSSSRVHWQSLPWLIAAAPCWPSPNCA